MTKFSDLFAALNAEFEAEEIRVRSQAGRQLHYITARTAMNRLDDVLGPENWWDDYTPLQNSVICRLSVRLPDGQVVTKQDAGGYAGMADQGDDDKSGFSDAFKRAAAKFGVARYLYRDGIPQFCMDVWRDGEERAAVRADGAEPTPPAPVVEQLRERFPDLKPAAALNGHGTNGHANGHATNGHDVDRASKDVPRSGKALFAWTKEQEQKHGVGLLKYLNSWAKLQEFPGRVVDFDAEQVGLAYVEAVRKLKSITAAN